MTNLLRAIRMWMDRENELAQAIAEDGDGRYESGRMEEARREAERELAEFIDLRIEAATGARP